MKFLEELGYASVKEYYKISRLRKRLTEHYGKRICALPQTFGCGFICDASIPLGDALEKLRILNRDTDKDEPSQILYKAAQLLCKDAKACKKENL